MRSLAGFRQAGVRRVYLEVTSQNTSAIRLYRRLGFHPVRIVYQTAKATEDISRRVETIQADTESAVAAIAQISSIIGRINDYQLTIASAVEEQTATTNEMNRGIAEAANGATDVATNLTEVASGANSATDALSGIRSETAGLARLANELQSTVARFRV